MENKIGKLNADDAMKAEFKDCEYIEIDDVIFIRKDKALELCNRAHAAQNRKLEALQLHSVVGRSEQLVCPECDNPYPRLYASGIVKCEECGHEWVN